MLEHDVAAVSRSNMRSDADHVAASNGNSSIDNDVENGTSKESPNNGIAEDLESHHFVASKSLVRRQDKRIVPLSAVIYFLCYLDQSNIGNGKIMNASTHKDLLTKTGMTTLFQHPAQKTPPLALDRVPHVLLGRYTHGPGRANGYAAITGVRFLLGVFEAGLFPGLVYYLTFWYRADERSVRVSFILASATLAGAFGGATAFAVGKRMNQVHSLSAWRWLFILEGVPSCLPAVAYGQKAGVWIYKADEAKKGYPTGHWVNDALLFVVAVGCSMLRLYYGGRNRATVKAAEGAAADVRLFKYSLCP
ncbi:hypothetical protein B0H63DRAFT_520963 [Podospora didyma]|uniref:Transporter n=1 Tax=Podospora didyma TaxID=330526 RepID=A0AAE0NSI3_9PEZI|nr:hypothetical protein B0H63DRAFT_520963 [Podospora didyma]